LSERKVTIRLNPEIAKLYDAYRKKWKELEQLSESQIFRAGLAYLMSMPEAVSEVQDKQMQENDQIMARMKEIIKKHPVPELYEQWEKLMSNTAQMYAPFEKSAKKYFSVIGDGKKGRKPPPYKKHTPGKYPDRGRV